MSPAMTSSSPGAATPDSATALLDAAFATIALHQRLSLAELADGARDRDFPARSMQTPGWFSAAAARTSRLAEMAPELAAAPADHGRLDLIHMYAPELDSAEPAEIPPLPAPVTPAAVDSDARRRLLAELRDIDT